MSDTTSTATVTPGAAPAAAGGGGGGPPGGGPAGAPIVAAIANSQARLDNLNSDLLGLVCGMLDTESLIALKRVNKPLSQKQVLGQAIEASERKDAEARDDVARVLAIRGNDNRESLTAMLRRRFGAGSGPECLDPIYFVRNGEDYMRRPLPLAAAIGTHLSNRADAPAEVINFARSLHLAAQAACRADVHYTRGFIGMIESTVTELDRLLGRPGLPRAEFMRGNKAKGDLVAVTARLQHVIAKRPGGP